MAYASSLHFDNVQKKSLERICISEREIPADERKFYPHKSNDLEALKCLYFFTTLRLIVLLSAFITPNIHIRYHNSRRKQPDDKPWWLSRFRLFWVANFLSYRLRYCKKFEVEFLCTKNAANFTGIIQI